MGRAKPELDSNEAVPGDLTDKIILITGGTSGLGAASAVALARRKPARIYISGRHRGPGADAVLAQIQDASAGATEAEFLACDLADLASVSAAADRLLARETRLDVFMANAGVAAVPPSRTRDGYEVHFGVNHVGHALLIRKLLPLLRQKEAGGTEPEPGAGVGTGGGLGGRVVTVTSSAFRGAVWGIPLDRVKAEGGAWGDWLMIWRWMRYAESKLANVVYARELARRYPDVVAVSVTPGFVETAMVAGMRFCDRIGTRLLGYMAGGMVTAEEGARNQVWAATADRAQLQNGATYEPVGVLCKNVGGPAADEILGERLWEWTEKEISAWL